jgi:hypothetical protein
MVQTCAGRGGMLQMEIGIQTMRRKIGTAKLRATLQKQLKLRCIGLTK